jgi:glycerol-3-phosphate cytidylyltransferase
MSILERLKEKYGEEKIEKFLNLINKGDRNFQQFYQYILLNEDYNDNNHAFFKSYVIPLLIEKYDKDRMFLYELINIIGGFDFTFKKYNTCITYGTFDLFHVGHLKLLERIKSMCSNLIVAVSTDEFNELKGKTCVIPYEQRAAIVGGLKFVDKVIPENNWEQKVEDIKKYNVDCFVMGDDWEGKFDYLKDYCEVFYLPRTEGISTTDLKQRLK